MTPTPIQAPAAPTQNPVTREPVGRPVPAGSAASAQAETPKAKPAPIPDPDGQVIKSEKQTFKIEVIARDYNHPSIIIWTPLNESWGVPNLEEPRQQAHLRALYYLTKSLDSTRLVIDNDGWEHTDITDICAIHDYSPTAERLQTRYHGTLESGQLPKTVWVGDKPLFARGSKFRGQPIVLSEVGGFLTIPEDVPPEKRDHLYRYYASFERPEELLEKYRDLMDGISSLKFLAGFCYTQLTDIEQEINGLLTYDRKPKTNPEVIAEWHRELFRG